MQGDRWRDVLAGDAERIWPCGLSGPRVLAAVFRGDVITHRRGLASRGVVVGAECSIHMLLFFLQILRSDGLMYRDDQVV